ncbi:MAG: prolipoprotein diacylglyceryl transferase [Candidatus Magasanikbacteria bacterium]
MITNNIDPIFMQIGFFTIRWYGLFLVLGICSVVVFWKKLFRENKIPKDSAYDLAVWLILGGTLGARLGEVLFYEPEWYFSHPLEILFLHHGGLSSHGMAIGLLLSFAIYAKVKKIAWKKWLDIIVIPMPILFACIRLGNYFNSEIIGRVTNVPWSVYFERIDSVGVLRHPSQIYELFLAVGIFTILYILYKKEMFPPGKLYYFHIFLLLYFSTRFFVEYFKDYEVLSIGSFFTTGQWLSLPFIIWSIIWFLRKK